MGPGGEPRDLTGRRFGPYFLIELIGRGGMGEVYRARDERLDRMVAVKVVRGELKTDSSARRRFVHETRAARQVSHPYIATVFDVLDEDDELLLVMELVEGRRLDHVLEGERPPLQTIAAWGVEIAEALDAIHRAGLVHRDLKPANVVVGDNGHLKIMDFGLARPLKKPAGKDSGSPTNLDLSYFTGDGIAVGTPRYMSPEQLCGESIDARSDLFALGVLLYEGISGRHPFERDTPLNLVAAILKEPPGLGAEPMALARSGALRGVILKLLEKDPARRFASAAEAARALAEARQGPTTPMPYAVMRAALSRRWLWGLAAGALLAAGGFAAWRRAGPPPAAARGPSRPTIAVLPFDEPGRPPGQEGHMLADLVAVSLAQSGTLRAVSMDRLAQVLGESGGALPRAERLRRVRKALHADALLAGTLYREGAGQIVTAELYEGASPDATGTFRAEGSRALLLADAVAAQAARLLAPAGRATPPPERATVPSDEVLLLVHRARAAARDFRYTETIALLERAVELDAAHATARMRLAEVLDRAGYGNRARAEIAAAERLSDATRGPGSERERLEVRAIRARIQGDPRTEIAARRLILEADRDDPESLLALAEALDRENRAEESVATLERLIARDPLDPRAHLARGDRLSILGRHDEAKAAFDDAERLWRLLGSPAGLGEVAFARGRAAYARTSLDEASRLFRQAADGLVAAGVPVRAAAAEVALAGMQMLRGEVPDALSGYQAAEKLARGSGDRGLVIAGVFGQGQALAAMGQYRRAETVVREAVAEARRIENPRLVLQALVGLGNLLGDLGRSQEQLGTATEALALAIEQRDLASQIHCLQFQSQAWRRQGQFPAARKQLGELAERGRRGQISFEQLAYVRFELAELEREAGRLEAAVAALDEAEKLARERGLSLALAHCMTVRSLLLIDLGDAAAAGKQLEAARSARKPQLGAHPEISGWERLVEASVALERGELAPAEAGFAAVRRQAEEMGSARLLCSASLGQGEALLGLREPGRAIDLARRARDLATCSGAERVRAGLTVAGVLSSQGRAGEAREQLRQALESSRAMELPLPIAQASAELLALAPRDEGAAALLAAGRAALAEYLETAPKSAREAVRSRSSIARLASQLGYPN